MIYESKKLVEICLQWSITPNQYMILYSIFRKDRVLEEYVIEYKAKNGFAPFTKTEINDLVVKGYLVNNNGVDEIYYKNDGLDIHNYTSKLELTEEFEDKFFMDSTIAGEELFASYPPFMNINGSQISLKKGGDINGKWFGRDYMIKYYAEYVGNDQALHDKIIATVKRVRSMGQLNMALRHFIEGHLWEDYFEIKDGSEDNITLI